MAKKIFVSNARIVKGRRWYLDFTRLDAETGQTTRHRQDFDLNDIPDLTIRQAVAERLVRYLHHFIRHDAPTAQKTDAEPATTVKDALQFAVKLKLARTVPETASKYQSVERLLLQWLEQRSYLRMPVADFTRKYARAFFDWYVTRRQYRAQTVNNQITHLRSLWGELIDREICRENPWLSVKPVRKEPKLRRAFDAEQRRIVAEEVERCDYWLFRGILLQFFCYVRPVELSRLRFKHFDFSTGTVLVDVHKGKQRRTRHATIPKSILPYFIDGKFEAYPANYFVLGKESDLHKEQRLGPSTTPADPDWQSRRHRKILLRLKKEGKIRDAENLSWYSWKDTGISLHAHQTTPLATKEQAGHADFAMTLNYYHAAQVNAEYRALANDLFLTVPAP